MSSQGIKLKEALFHYNSNRKKGVRKLKYLDVGRVWFPELSDNTITNYMSMIASGKRQGLVTKKRVNQLCKLTGVDANFLFETKKMRK